MVRTKGSNLGELPLVGIKLIKQSPFEQLRGAHFWEFAERYQQVALIADNWESSSVTLKSFLDTL